MCECINNKCHNKLTIVSTIITSANIIVTGGFFCILLYGVLAARNGGS
jgi:hypothetical protein